MKSICVFIWWYFVFKPRFCLTKYFGPGEKAPLPLISPSAVRGGLAVALVMGLKQWGLGLTVNFTNIIKAVQPFKVNMLFDFCLIFFYFFLFYFFYFFDNLTFQSFIKALFSSLADKKIKAAVFPSFFMRQLWSLIIVNDDDANNDNNDDVYGIDDSRDVIKEYFLDHCELANMFETHACFTL
jgi:CRISPR-associated Cas5-like protein